MNNTEKIGKAIGNILCWIVTLAVLLNTLPSTEIERAQLTTYRRRLTFFEIMCLPLAIWFIMIMIYSILTGQPIIEILLEGLQ